MIGRWGIYRIFTHTGKSDTAAVMELPSEWRRSSVSHHVSVIIAMNYGT